MAHSTNIMLSLCCVPVLSTVVALSQYLTKAAHVTITIRTSNYLKSCKFPDVKQRQFLWSSLGRSATRSQTIEDGRHVED